MEYLVEFLLLGVGLAMDAFAVSICKGLAMRKVNKKQAVIIALFFGGFQAIMPVIGWLLCKGFQTYIEAFDHWIAFALLAFIGVKMIIETLREKEDDVVIEEMDPPLDMKEMLMLAIATSIDALAVGISLAALDRPIVESAAIIGVVTFVISIIGVYIGNFFGNRYKKRAELTGGIILVLIGVKILCEHSSPKGRAGCEAD